MSGAKMSAQRRTRSGEISLLLRLIDEAYRQRTWHGPNLRGSLRGLSAEEAAWRPSPKRHNIWEIVVHAAYWKYIVRRRLLGEEKGSFPLKGSNWFTRPATPGEQAWRDDLRLLDEMQTSLRKAVEELPAAALSKFPKGSKVANDAIIYGIANHDIYHAGQIQLLKRLARK